jgi:hypothetical protein
MRGRARKNQGAGASAKRRKRRGAATQVTGDEEPEPEQQPQPWDTPMSKLEVLKYFKDEITSSVSGQTEGFNENTIRHTHSLPPFPLSLSVLSLFPSSSHHGVDFFQGKPQSLAGLLGVPVDSTSRQAHSLPSRFVACENQGVCGEPERLEKTG